MKSRIPRLNAIVDAEAAARAGWSLVDLAGRFLDGGVTFLQVRAKQLSGAALLDAARAIVARAQGRGAIVLMNDRADIAAIAEADGVHLGQDDLAPAAARSILGPSAVIGRSTHTEAQVDAAMLEPVDYVAVGPVFGSATKATGYDAVGLELVRRAARSGRPVVAIGGITLANAASVIAAGATSVAVIGDLLIGDPEARARDFVAALRDVRANPD